MKNICLIIMVLLGTYSIQAQSETELIRKALMNYIEGSTNGQPDRLKQTFHPDLNLYYVKNDTIRLWSGKDYILDTKEGKPTGESGKILSIDYENNAATAKVEISHPDHPNSYIDYFLLLKTHDEWKIIHKMFTKRITTNDPQENDLIKKTIGLYFDGWMTGDTLKLGKAMHKTCKLKFIRDGQMVVYDRQKYLSLFKPRPKLANSEGRIISLNITRNAASAKCELETPKRKFTDYFNLMKVQNTWFIVDKISTSISKESPD